jgi:hypothetical protein
MSSNEQMTRQFSKALLYSASVLTGVRDTYLYRSLQDAIEHCVRAGIRTSCQGPSFIQAIMELHRWLQEVGAIETGSLRSLLLAERHVLLVLLHSSSEPISKEKHERTAKERKPAQPAPSAGANGTADRTMLMNGQVSPSAQQVLRGVQETGPVRAKDIIRHCRPMSERTVRRSLSELVTTGLIVKDANNGTVRYKVARGSDA